MKPLRLSLLLLSLAFRVASAQVGAGTVVLRTHLGADSGQAAVALLRSGATYRVAMRPASTVFQIRPPSRGTLPNAPLVLGPLRMGDSVAGGTGGVFRTDRAGNFVVELTEAVAVPIAIEITLVALAPGDVLPRDGAPTLIFSEIVSEEPGWVTLDSGVVYRIIPAGTVYIAPRLLNQAPVRIAPLVSASGSGFPFIPAHSGEFRIYGDPDEGPVGVRIYRDEADQRELSCVRDPSQRGCRSSGPARGHETIRVLLLAAFIILYTVR